MNDLIVKVAQWQRLKALVPDSVSSPITLLVYNEREFTASYSRAIRFPCYRR
jgi:hypothetical protein